MQNIHTFITLIICGILLAAGCSPAPAQFTDSPSTQNPSNQPTNKPEIEPTIEPSRQPTTEPTNPPTKLPTKQPTNEPTSETFDFTWEGTWNVWVSAPRISIVNQATFEITDKEVRTSWYEGTRQVTLEGKLSDDGSTIIGTFWNTDVEVLDITLILDPSGAFFTGLADDSASTGQFCGTRTNLNRPSPCRANIP